METLLLYFIKVNGLLIVFYLAYYFLLRKETFFQSNRWFLLIGILSSFLLPLITYTEIVWIEPEPIVYTSNTFIPITNFETSVITEPFDWQFFLTSAYILVSLAFLIKILIELISFIKIIKNGNKIKTEGIYLVETDKSQNPFSFFNYLVFNKESFTKEELEMIIIHEKVHIIQKHSIDVLIGKLLCIILWINPISWLYRKAILENLEFIADSITTKSTNNIYNYQKTLLKTVVYYNQLSITNQFYQSLIKKRIVMLNTNPSQKKNIWKYSLVLPFLIGFIFLFQIETKAQVRENSINSEIKATEAVAVAIGFVTDKNSTDAEMKLDTEELKKQGIEYKFSKIKRNKKGEIIAIKIEFNDNKGQKGVKEIKGDEPIEPIYFSTENNSIGFTEAPDLSDYIVDEKLSKQFGTEIKVKRVNGNRVENNSIGINWDGAVKLSESQDLPNHPNKKQLYIINGKEYSSEDLKGKKIELDGTIIHYFKEEALQKFGEKGKNGVLVFEGKSTFSDGIVNEVNYSANKFENIKPKNIKLTFQKGKEYIIGGKKYTYNDLKDKNWFLYTGTPNKIEEKNNIVTITGDVVVDAENSNTQEVIYVIEPEKIENKKFVLENGNWLVIFENEMIKIPKYPTYSLKNVKIEIDGIEVLSKFEVLKKYDSNSFKEVKVIEDHLSTDENLIIKNIIIKTK